MSATPSGTQDASPPRSPRHSGTAGWTAGTSRTSGLNVRAEVDWQEGQGQTVSGYLASSVLRVRHPRTGRRPPGSSPRPWRPAATTSGSTASNLASRIPAAVHGPRPGSGLGDALAAAEHLAALAGARLGKVLSIAQQPGYPAPIPVARMQRAVATDSLAVEAGESSVERHGRRRLGAARLRPRPVDALSRCRNTGANA